VLLEVVDDEAVLADVVVDVGGCCAAVWVLWLPPPLVTATITPTMMSARMNAPESRTAGRLQGDCSSSGGVADMTGPPFVR
jgi:hypothetical protein